jgi:hypothetical protein
MPGSLLQSINLGNTYDTFWEYTQTDLSTSWANSSTGIFTVPATPAHPFVTGDVMYVRLFSSTGGAVGGQLTAGKYYAIVISSTQLKYASTRENALAGISLNIPANLWAITSQRTNGIGNTPDCGYNFFRGNTAFKPDEWLASSRSSNDFDVSTNVRIEVTHNQKRRGASYALATPTFSSCFGLTFWALNSASGLAFFPGDNVSLNEAYTGTVRFEIINRRVSMLGQLTSGSFVTIYTSSELSASSAPFYFYANFGLNSMSATDCTITYL